MKDPFEINTWKPSKKLSDPFATKRKESFPDPFSDTNNTIKTNLSFNNIISDFNNSNDIILKSYAESLKQIQNTLSDRNSTEVRNILWKLSQTKNYEKINKYIEELNKIAEKYEEKKKKVVKKTWEGLLNEAENAPEIKNPKEFILNLLKARNGWKNRISESFAKAEHMSEKELADEIKSIKVPFDAEPEDWDLYFKENNIPKDKQNQFKKYFYAMRWKKAEWFDPISSNWHDFGNISFIDDFGDKIWNESERILNLSSWEEITINIPDLNPSDWKLVFKTKKEALLYLYYTKLLYREVGTFLEDIIQWWKNLWTWIKAILNFIAEYPWEVFYTILAYMWIATSWTIARKINVWVLRKTSWKFWFWEYLNPVIRWEEWWFNIEWAELKRREDLIKALREEFSW